MFDVKFDDEFYKNQNKFNWVYNLIEDIESKDVFENIINFRLNYDLMFMKKFQYDPIGQYFEDFLELNKKNEIFADIGCFDGFTTKRFIDFCPEYKEIHVFEPDLINLEKIKQNLKKYRSIYFYGYGLSDSEKTLKFNSMGSDSSGFSDNGVTDVQVKTLDSLDKPFTFMKLDIEGGEKNAILGSVKTIRKYHPKIAISVYHRADDFWRIPELILNIRSDYKIYLRHYTEGFAETVMFFVPEK